METRRVIAGGLDTFGPGGPRYSTAEVGAGSGGRVATEERIETWSVLRSGLDTFGRERPRYSTIGLLPVVE